MANETTPLGYPNLNDTKEMEWSGSANPTRDSFNNILLSFESELFQDRAVSAALQHQRYAFNELVKAVDVEIVELAPVVSETPEDVVARELYREAQANIAELQDRISKLRSELADSKSNLSIKSNEAAIAQSIISSLEAQLARLLGGVVGGGTGTGGTGGGGSGGGVIRPPSGEGNGDGESDSDTEFL